jgi:translation initiation factor IF-2
MKTKAHSTTKSRPPIVAVLGHVDHGKTSLLDAIRKTSVTQSEHGGITQHIGAYQISVPQKDTSDKKITFIDTPGHEAFAKMRSRGAQVADIAILVVAATEGVKPQTEESVKHIKAAGVPIIVAANKMDLPEANLDKTKQQLAKIGVLVENFGGDVVLVPVSAKTGTGIPQLLETILLVGEMKELAADPEGALAAVVVEARLDKRRGPLSTVLIKDGTLKQGDTIYSDTTEAKVRAMFDDHGTEITQALPSMPVEIMGWKTVPAVGSTITTQKMTGTGQAAQKFQPKAFSLPPLETQKKLKMILKTDVAGTLEAVRESLGDAIEFVSTGSGEISESDILLAKSTGSVVIGFNLKPSGKVIRLAQAEKVRIKTYAIIYELLEEITEVTELLNRPEAAEEELGEAVILAQFNAGEWPVAGCRIERGRIVRGDTVKIMRRETEIGRTRIKSIRHGKEDIPKAEVSTECGIVLEKKLDFRLGDRIIAYKQPELLA